MYIFPLYFGDTEAGVQFPKCLWSNPDGYSYYRSVSKEQSTQQRELDRTRRKASEICLLSPLNIYSHKFSR